MAELQINIIIHYFEHNILQHPVTHNFVSNIFAFDGP